MPSGLGKSANCKVINKQRNMRIDKIYVFGSPMCKSRCTHAKEQDSRKEE